MKLHRRIISACGCTFFAFLVAQSMFAQDLPIAWGQIPRSDLEMKSYLPDTNASALILCDYGESAVDRDYQLIFTRHMRIKILTAKGFDWGNHAITIYSKKKNERIYDIQGATYWLDDKNEVATSALESKDIFEEAVDEDYTRYRFALPALKLGCVVEFRYKILTENLWFIHDWWFQYSEPARWSEYRILSPENIGFTTVFRKNQELAVAENEDVKCRNSNLGSFGQGQKEKLCYMIRLAMKDVPALREEPFITTMDDYRSKVKAQYAGWASSSGGVFTVLTEWNKLGHDLMNSDAFGGCIDDTRNVRAQTNAVIAGLTSPEEKLNAIYRWVSSSIVWSGKRTFESNREVNDVLETKSGSSSEITFLLMSMLKSAGIPSDPVILSTRDNGQVQETYPIISQFNYVLTRVPIGSQEYYVDATDALRPMNELPMDVLNVKALVVNRDSVRWVTLETTKRQSATSVVSAQVHADGSLSGTLDNSYGDYAGLRLRQKLSGAKQVDVARDHLDSEGAGITLDSVSFACQDSIAMPLKLHAILSSPAFAQTSGDFIHFNPYVFHRQKDNPFKSKVRTFPVDYSCPSEITTVASFTIPDSFEVSGRVSNKSFMLLGSTAVFNRSVDVRDRKIYVTTRFEIRQPQFDTYSYPNLREFYSQVVAAESEQFVLSHVKRPAPAPADTAGQAAPKILKGSKKAGRKTKP